MARFFRINFGYTTGTLTPNGVYTIYTYNNNVIGTVVDYVTSVVPFQTELAQNLPYSLIAGPFPIEIMIDDTVTQIIVIDTLNTSCLPSIIPIGPLPSPTPTPTPTPLPILFTVQWVIKPTALAYAQIFLPSEVPNNRGLRFENPDTRLQLLSSDAGPDYGLINNGVVYTKNITEVNPAFGQFPYRVNASQTIGFVPNDAPTLQSDGYTPEITAKLFVNNQLLTYTNLYSYTITGNRKYISTVFRETPNNPNTNVFNFLINRSSVIRIEIL